MLWTIDQVLAMRSYTFSQAVDMFTVERASIEGEPNPVLAAVTDHLYHGLEAAGHTWGLQIHQGDCEVKVEPAADGHMMDVVRMRWNPTTRAGLLIGGHLGGKVMQFPENLHKRGVRVLLPPTQPIWSADVEDTVLPAQDIFYAYAGWSETRRMWVYRVDSKAPQVQ